MATWGKIMEAFFEKHSGELVIVVLCLLLLGTLMVLVPQLLRAHLRKVEMAHLEHMRALENGLTVPIEDDRATIYYCPETTCRLRSISSISFTFRPRNRTLGMSKW